MSFYIFQLDKLVIKHKRGNIPDDDVVTFTVFVNQLDRGHGSATFTVLTPTTRPALSENYPAKNRFNMTEQWKIGPLEILPRDNVNVVYTGTNVSDEQLNSIATKEQDDLEIKILNYVAKKYVELIAGAEFGSDIGSLLSDAFDKAFKNPIGDLIGYQPLGPCNGPVFSDAVPFTGSGLDQLNYAPQPPIRATPPMPSYSIATSIRTYTDETTHDTNICGPIAETDVVFSVVKVSFISVRYLVQDRFPSTYPGQHGPGLRQYDKTGKKTISIKSLLGVLP